MSEQTARDVMLEAMGRLVRIVTEDDTCFIGSGTDLADAILAALDAAGYAVVEP